jgi:hypothetical protein
MTSFSLRDVGLHEPLMQVWMPEFYHERNRAHCARSNGTGLVPVGVFSRPARWGDGHGYAAFPRRQIRGG